MKSCKKCGGFDLYKDGRCRPCISAAVSARRAKNPDKYNASRLAWAKANPDKRRAIQAKYVNANRENINKKQLARHAADTEKHRLAKAAWRKANPEITKASTAAWAKANPEAKRIHSNNRRARKIESGGKLSNGLSVKLFKLQRGKCACGCKQPLGDDYHLDHIMPLALGGTNTDDNIQLLRSICNLQKNAKHPVDFMQQRGFLI
jgi:hypothetical protein